MFKDPPPGDALGHPQGLLGGSAPPTRRVLLLLLLRLEDRRVTTERRSQRRTTANQRLWIKDVASGMFLKSMMGLLNSS
jgi:hypothetical protein